MTLVPARMSVTHRRSACESSTGSSVRVMLDEDALLDFDRSQLFGWSQEDEDRHLAEHRELFLNHLLIAKHLEVWAANLVEQELGGLDPQRKKGYVDALDAVAAHLRLGHYLPGGTFHSVHEPQPWRRWTAELGIDPPDSDPPRTSRRW